MRALVTGAAGFIGSKICQRLLADGHHVLGVDCFSDYYSAELKKSNVQSLRNQNFTLVNEDLNEMDFSSLDFDIELVFHEAGQPGVRKSWGADFGNYTLQNISATQRLLEQAKNMPSLKKFVNASSSSVYGNATSYPTFETDLPMPISPYGVTKLAAEHLCSLYATAFNIPIVSLRYFTVYGPGQRPDMAFTRFLLSAVRGEQIEIFGDGEQLRDYTFVADVVEANMLAAFNYTHPGSVFNVAGGTSVTVNEVIQLISEISDVPLKTKRVGAVAGDATRTGGSTKKIEMELGWEAKTNLIEGLREQLAWVRENFS